MSSFFIYLLAFLLGQYVVVLARADLGFAIAYADVQLLCGAQVLVLSRALLMYENRMIRDARVAAVGTAAVAWVVIFTVGLYVVVHQFRPDLAYVYACLAFAFLGRFPLATIAQFVRPAFRGNIQMLLLLCNLALGAALLSKLQGATAMLVVLVFSPTLASAVLLVRARFASTPFFLRSARGAADA